MQVARRIRRLLAPVTAGLLSAWLFALLVTVTAVAANHYLLYGFTRSIVFLFGNMLGRSLAFSLAIVLTLTAVTWLRSYIRGRLGDGLAAGDDGVRFIARLLAPGVGLAFFLRLSYIHNRFRFSHYWFRTVEVGGIRLPEALCRWDVWKTNLLIALSASAIALVAWLILRGTLLRRPELAARCWHRLGSAGAVCAAILVVTVPLLAGTLLRQRTSGLPNIILVSIDTLRADRLGAYGYHRDTSPEMDSLASTSVLFEWALSQAPNTSPSHMSMFTSLYPTVHGFTAAGNRLAGWRLTLAEYLRERGYRTLATTDGAYMRGWYGFDQGFEQYSDFKKGIAKAVRLAFRWLDGGVAEDRFFLFIHCYDVHSPYTPPPPYRDLYTDPNYDGGFHPGSRQLEAIRRAVRRRDPERGHGLSPADIEFISARYDGGIRYTDHWIGSLVDGLASRGLDGNTWLFITSDHGEEFTEHGSVLHEKLYHTVTHVPLIVRPPGGSRPGRRIPEIVELTDLMPTMLEIAGIEPVRALEGRSLMDLMAGKADGWKDVAYSEHPWFGERRAITTPTLHVLTSHERRELEAYAYREDPLELSRLPDSVASEETREAMRSLLVWDEDQAAIAQVQAGGARPVSIDEATRAELRALGYLD